MPKLPYCPICIRQIEFLELYAIPHSFCANIQLFPCLSGSWLAVFLPALYCLCIDCLFAYTVFAQVIEYETKVLKIDLNTKKRSLALGTPLAICRFIYDASVYRCGSNGFSAVLEHSES